MSTGPGRATIENVRVTHIGEVLASSTPGDVLVAYGVGSCVVICMHDPVARVGGMLHALLPAAADGSEGTGSCARFVDQGIPLLIDALLGQGAASSRLNVYLCGGARMFADPGLDDLASIGERNVLAAEVALQSAGLGIVAQATRGHTGRTVRFSIATGLVSVRAVGESERVLNAEPEIIYNFSIALRTNFHPLTNTYLLFIDCPGCKKSGKSRTNR